MPDRVYAGEQQQVGRADRTGTEDNLPSFNGEGLTASLHQQTNRALASKNNPADLAIGSHRQVKPMPGLTQVAQAGAEPDPVVVVG